MKKVVISLAIIDIKDKKKVLRAVSGISGVESITMDKDNKLTVIGDVDPVEVVGKLRKTWHPDLVSVGPAKAPEKKDEPAKKAEEKKDTTPTESEQVADLIKFYKSYNYNAHLTQPQSYYHMTQSQPSYYSHDDNPNSCVIC